jgi:mannonate dehydratase
MREAWRWFGPNDPVSIADIRQTGATDIVSALHTIPTGEVWPILKIQAHKALIEQYNSVQSSLVWSVVESIPVHEDIKLGLKNGQGYVDAWIASMENLSKCGIKTICYNFMPVIDWTRTDLKFRLPNGGYSLRFDQQKFAAFDLFILKRENASADYSDEELTQAKSTFSAMSGEEQALLTKNIIAGLPGKMTDSYDIDTFRSMLAKYKDITKDVLRKNLFSFLSQVLSKAEQLGVKLAIHPDDPPRDMLGLPRIICTSKDLDILFTELPSPSNGITLCAGTYGSRPDNDLPEMAKKYGPRIHFAHLRGVSRDKNEQRSFYEAEHLSSDVDMVGIISALLKEEQSRKESENNREIFIRPDHGHQILDDINKQGNPGYSCIGRLKGLAEIRGVIKALSDVNQKT